MNWSSSVLSSVSSDTEPSIIITFDHAKYIFNTSENTTRSFLQSGRNWKKTRALFYTQARVEKTGGLPGLIMTFADATIDNLSLYGPRGFNNLLASMRFYTYRETMKVQSTEIPWIITPTSDPTPTYVDDNLTVYAIPVIPCSDIPVSSTPKTLDNTTTILDISGKRKRDTSPDVPQKRPNTGNSSSKGLYSAALEHEMKKENFEPESLTGELADEYVSAVIRAMFPFTKPNAEKGKVTKPGSTKQKPKSPIRGVSSSKVGQPPSPKLEEKADVDDYRRSKVPIPPGFRLQLPQSSIGLSPTKAPPAMSYLVVGPTFRGKFNAEKATELGVPKGKIRSLLARGESITFDVKVGDEIIQRTVMAEEVVAQPEKPSAILILDVPSVDHIPSLISSFTSSDFYLRFWSQGPTVSEPKESDAVLRVAYHMCGEGVLEDQRYKAFMRGFGSVVHHIVGSREHCSDPVTFTSAAYSQLRLNTLDDQIFRVPKYRLHARKSLSEVHGLPENISPMHSHMKTAMRPWNPPSPDPEVVKRDKFHPIASGSVPLEFSPGLKQSIDNARKTVAQIVSEKLVDTTGPGSDVGIISLGTGGSMPSKYRNVLSTFIRIPKWGNILLDSGEGTWGQMVRNFGLEDSEYNVWQALRDLKCIFISHIHADHHIGLANILAKRKLLDPPPTEPLYVVSIRGVHLYLREISAVEDIGLNDPSGNGVVPVLTESMHYTARTKYTGEGIWHIGGDEPWLDFTTSFNNGRQMCNTLGLNSFQTIDVFHRCRCYGVVLRHKDGWSVAFSADTSPSDQLRRLGVDTTVLIHEATMADEEAEMARKKNHSTIGQAIAEGKKMRSKNIMLTHFSARYPKMPPYLTQTTPTATNFTQHNAIVPAFDHANFIIGDMWKMQFYTPSVSRNFKDTFSEEEDEDVDSPPTNVSLG